jgi:ribosomal-protein-alanine N-acetyltransferase
MRPPSGALHLMTKSAAKIEVRPLRASDYAAWRNALSSFHAPKNRWDRGPAQLTDLTKTAFRNLLAEQKAARLSDSRYEYGVFVRQSGIFVGATALMDVSRGVFQNAYLGYWIGNTAWGRSYGSAAARLTIALALGPLKLHRVEAAIHPSNRRSLKLARSLGMRREGLSRRRLFLPSGRTHRLGEYSAHSSSSQWQDLAIYAVTSEECGITWTAGKIKS